MENLPFDLPNTIYINILHNLRNLGGMDDIYYPAFMNKMLWDQGVYRVFDKLDDNLKHNLKIKGSMVAKQQSFSKTNLKAMKVVMEEQKLIPQVDVEAIKQRKQKRLTKAIANKDKGLNSFGITKKIQNIMKEQQQRKKTKRQSHH